MMKKKNAENFITRIITLSTLLILLLHLYWPLDWKDQVQFNSFLDKIIPFAGLIIVCVLIRVIVSYFKKKHAVSSKSKGNKTI